MSKYQVRRNSNRRSQDSQITNNFNLADLPPPSESLNLNRLDPSYEDFASSNYEQNKFNNFNNNYKNYNLRAPDNTPGQETNFSAKMEKINDILIKCTDSTYTSTKSFLNSSNNSKPKDIQKKVSTSNYSFPPPPEDVSPTKQNLAPNLQNNNSKNFQPLQTSINYHNHRRSRTNSASSHASSILSYQENISPRPYKNKSRDHSLDPLMLSNDVLNNSQKSQYDENHDRPGSGKKRTRAFFRNNNNNNNNGSSKQELVEPAR